jgi:hypothetical protein
LKDIAKDLGIEDINEVMPGGSKEEEQKKKEEEEKK